MAVTCRLDGRGLSPCLSAGTAFRNQSSYRCRCANSGQMPSVLTYGTRKALIGSSIKPFAEERKVSLLVLCALALVIGVMTGLGAVGFRALIGLVHNLSYNGRLSVVTTQTSVRAPVLSATLFFLRL